MIKKIGIECHNLEGPRFGVGQTLIQLLEALCQTPGVAEKFEFYLYFKKEIPSDKILESPIFHKKILRAPFAPPSFLFFFHFLIPLRYFIDSLDGFFFPGYMLPAFFFGRSAVILTNDVHYEIYHGSLPWRYRVSYRLFSWWAVKKADKIITISQTAKKEISKLYHLSLNKIEVVSWGLNKDLARMLFSEEKIENIKKKFLIKKDFIFSWGQAFPRRHVKEAILAFAKIAKDFPDLQYFIACTDKYNPPVLEATIKKINIELGREAIIYKSYIEDQNDLFCLIKASKLVIYISSSEAMGLPPIEAISLKTPSVIADDELTHEIFGDNAFFVKNPDDVSEIAMAIKNGILNEDKRREIVENRHKVVEKFSWSVNSGKLLEVFDKIF